MTVKKTGQTAPARKKSPKRDSQATKTRILSAAQKHFSANIYENVNLRAIAKDADVDVALVSRYFGSKEQLFSQITKVMLPPPEFTEDYRATFGRTTAEMLFADPPEPALFEQLYFILNSVISPKGRVILREVGYGQVLKPLADWLEGDDGELRSYLISTATLSVLLGRLVNPEIHRDPKSVAKLQRLAQGWFQSCMDGDLLASGGGTP